MRQFTYWQEPDGTYLGYLNDYPDYMTQGSTFDELKAMLGDIIDAIRDGDLIDTARPAALRDQGVPRPAHHPEIGVTRVSAMTARRK